MTLKNKVMTALKKGPKNIHQLAELLYGTSSPENIAAARMVIVRIRKDDPEAIVTDKEVTYELPRTYSKSRAREPV
jgi:hypothetical protein